MNSADSLVRILKQIGEGNEIQKTDRDVFSSFFPNNLYDILKLIDFEALDDYLVVLVFIGMVRQM